LKGKHVKRAGILLIAVALIAGTVGCGATPIQYNLSISSTEGGTVTAPGEGIFAYNAGTVVSLHGTPDTGHQFVSWTGDVDTIGNVNASQTIITTNGNYFIVANFAEISLVQDSLSIDSTEGGSVIWPGEGVFAYDRGTVVGLVTEAEQGYSFVEWTGNVSTIANIHAASTTITMLNNYSITARFEPGFMVTAGNTHTVGLSSNETVVATGQNNYGQCNVGGWTGIAQVAAGVGHTVGLKLDGTVVAVGSNSYGQCNVGGWTGIVQIAAGAYHTIGLMWDGTVVAVGRNDWGACNVGEWTNIVQVAGGGFHTLGLKLDGTVVAVGANSDGGQCNVSGWTNIVQVAGGWFHTLGLKSDGTVVAVGANNYGECNLDEWADIIEVSAGVERTVGLKWDRTVVAVGRGDYGACNVGGWTGIMQVATGGWHTVGLKLDGTVVAVGSDSYGQCDVSGWDLNG
jgi:hypothetical protein